MRTAERTLQAIRKDPNCLMARSVEKWVPVIKVRKDLFGADVQALFEGHVLAVQATSLSGLKPHVKDAVASHEVSCWLIAGQRFEVWGWRKLGHRWKARRVEIVLSGVGLDNVTTKVPISLERGEYP